jgi:hypothetical protein
MKRVVAALFSVLALTAGAPAADARPANRYPVPFEQAFMRSCTQARSDMVAMCRCALRWLERRYTYQRLVSIFRNDPRRFSRIALAAVTACRR